MLLDILNSFCVPIAPYSNVKVNVKFRFIVSVRTSVIKPIQVHQPLSVI